MRKPSKSTKPFSPREEYMAYMLRLSARAFHAMGVDKGDHFAAPDLIKEFLIENDKTNLVYED